MKKVLLVYAVSHRIQNPLGGVAPPSGLSWIARALQKNSYDFKICDLSIVDSEKGKEALLRNSISEYLPDAIGISIRNIDTSVNPPRTFFPFLENIATIIKSETSVPMILGGPGFSLYSKKCMNRLNADYGIIGEGEIAFPKLLNHLFSGAKKQADIPGLVLRNNGHLHSIKAEIFDNYPSFGKALHDGIDYEKYREIGGFYPIQTKRGCAFNCVYCDYPYLEGSKYRLRNPEDIVDEMQGLLSKHSMRHFFFTDSVFNYPQGFCKKIVKEIINRKMDIRWTAYVNPCSMTRDLVELFKISGCCRLEVTIDSASTETLNTYQKHFSVKDIINADSWFEEFDIPTYYWVNVGGPGETSDSLKENFENLSSLKQVTKGWLGCGFVVLPGSPLYQMSVYEGRIDDNGNGDPYLYVSDRLPDDYAEQIQLFCIEHPAWFSVYDMLDRDYRDMALNVIDKKIRNHWPMQMDYGKKRKLKYLNGELNVFSQKEYFQILEQKKGLKN